MFVVLNLGTIVLGTMIPVVIFLIITLVIKTCLKKYLPIQIKLTNYLFFDKTFDFINETYLLLAMCTTINLLYLKWDQYGAVINNIITILLLVLIVSFPLFIYCFYQRSLSNFARIYHKEKTFMSRFGSLTKGLAIFRVGPSSMAFVWLT